jgi:hypothetical protein
MDGSPAPDVTLERLHEIADSFARRNVDGIVNSFAEDGESAMPGDRTIGARASRARLRSAATSSHCSPTPAT